LPIRKIHGLREALWYNSEMIGREEQVP
jgi:hypothetical protein